MNAIDTNVLVYSFLSHWDSLLIAACIEANVDTLYSDDLGDGEQYDTMRVVNPFS